MMVIDSSFSATTGEDQEGSGDAVEKLLEVPTRQESRTMFPSHCAEVVLAPESLAMDRRRELRPSAPGIRL
jgi:hypothetical protein